MSIAIRYIVTPQDINLIIEKHRRLYEDEFGFNSEFGDYVEKTLHEEVERIWIAEEDGVFAGVVGLVEADPVTAQFRWFLVEPSMRGKGVGTLLMDAFLDYCRTKGYEKVFLWTVNALPAAKAVYERYGFTRTERKPEVLLWGRELAEERWDLSLKRNR